jgi:hypothetical protein
MARIITKELALKIAVKLQAKKSSKSGRAHDDYLVFYAGKLIAKFSVRHASEKDKGHDFIPRAIFLGPHDAKLFGQCDISYDAWVKKMKEKGIIPREPNDPV